MPDIASHTSLRLPIDRDRVEAYCRKWKIVELAFFGSVLRDDFRPDSDVDVLVRFAEGSRWSLLDVVRAENELSEIVGRDVDLVERKAVEMNAHKTRNKHILGNMQEYYVAG
ncbi:MAG: nucleotidyltransferase family protein [Calditrichaeota bacterium]|nr:nucleotidyltransferase family protein [Calditrichota bacterium]